MEGREGGQEYSSIDGLIRYRHGGSFAKHQDTMALTVLCLLDDKGFEGGGTEFWEETQRPDHTVESPAAARLHPAAGVGMVFHGELWHAGAPVVSGIRYLLVASFKQKG